tara:strand:+ start:13 stop:312 length:300 start_codon:yes stop_codon:yes gene_type:complete
LKLFRKNLLQSQKLKVLVLVFFSLIFNNKDAVFSSQENYFEEIEINNTTKNDYENNKVLPTNPFEIVDMIRKANSLNDATNPSDAIDEAIKSFDNLKLK